MHAGILAQNQINIGGGALIPTPPLAVYDPFRDSTTVSSTPSYYDTLDSLATLVGGGTPLYSALDILVGKVAVDASVAGIANVTGSFSASSGLKAVSLTSLSPL